MGISAPAAGSARLIGEAATAAGDVFRPHIEFVDAGGNVSAEPGIELVFDESGNIHHGTRPLPAGSYAVGVKASALGGAPVLRNQPTIIDYSGAAEGFRAFVVAEQNLQFLYPANWLLPTTQDDVTFASDPAGTVRLQIRYYPDRSESLVELQRQALATFGDVSILQQEATSVGVEPPVDALRTAYGYEEGDGEKRTGVFLTFIKDSSGYVVDIDGPGEQEAATLSTIATVAATWQFLPERLGFGPESWLALEIADFSLQRPSDFVHEEINGWHRLTGGPQTFIAVRIQPAGRSPTEAMSGLLQTASEGVPDFMAEEPRPTVYGGYVWESSNFTYTDANGAIVSGLLLSRSYGDHEIAFWAEAPDPAGEFFQAIFLPVAGSIEPLPLP